jgi:ABC-type bacteriocin/lantibiotic exporter with double-glycine peptidase domain
MGYQALSRWSQIKPSLDQLNRFMGAADVEPSTSLSDPWVLSMPKGNVELSNVTLRLNALQEPTLSQVSIKILAGQLVVISGPEGSGRSALLRLIDGQIQPGSGVLRFDGTDSRQFPLSQRRQSVDFLPEQPGLFSASLRENMMIVDPFTDDQAITRSLRSLALSELLEGPGLHRPLSMKGEHSLPPYLSQGIAIARLLLGQAPILLLDQLFRLLDQRRLEALLTVLQQRKGHGTTLVVSDEPRLLELADQIIVMRAGTVSFSGTPQELLAAQQKVAMQQAAMGDMASAAQP